MFLALASRAEERVLPPARGRGEGGYGGYGGSGPSPAPPASARAGAQSRGRDGGAGGAMVNLGAVRAEHERVSADYERACMQLVKLLPGSAEAVQAHVDL